jgi:hypothetical protein
MSEIVKEVIQCLEYVTIVEKGTTAEVVPAAKARRSPAERFELNL